MATEAFTVEQAMGAVLSHKVMRAAGERLRGDPMPLVEIVQSLREPEQGEPIEAIAPEPTEEALSFRSLSKTYLDDQGDSLKASSFSGITSSCKTLSDLLGGLDMRKHTRGDLVNLKAELSEGRTVATVNKLLGTLSTVLQWGVNNGHLDKAYSKKLRYTKNTDSTRKPFSKDQVKDLMSYTQSLPKDSFKKWSVSLGVVTGARIGEIHQLTKGDIKQVEGVWCIDINEDGDKELKNKYSARLVPLVDGSYGFNLKEFLEFVEATPEGPLFSLKYKAFCQQVNTLIRIPLGLQATGGDLTFHSLRHSLASAMKAESISVGVAQSILGHSSQSITFDLYGGNQQVGLEKLYDALKITFG
jgi:integrase